MIMRFSQRTAQAMIRAYMVAKSYTLDYIGTEHLLAGVVAEGEGPSFEALSQQGLTEEHYKDALDKVVDSLVDMSEGRMPEGFDPSMFGK